MDEKTASEYLHKVIPSDPAGASYLYYRFLLEQEIEPFKSQEEFEKWVEALAKRLKLPLDK